MPETPGGNIEAGAGRAGPIRFTESPLIEPGARQDEGLSRHVVRKLELQIRLSGVKTGGSVHD